MKPFPQNDWIDRGAFLLVIYTMIYLAHAGKQPEWPNLFIGAFMLILIGIGIEIYKKVKHK